MSTFTDFRSTPIDRHSFTTPFTSLISVFSLAPGAAALIYMDNQAIELIDQLHIVNLEDDTLIFNPDKIEKNFETDFIGVYS